MCLYPSVTLPGALFVLRSSPQNRRHSDTHYCASRQLFEAYRCSYLNPSECAWLTDLALTHAAEHGWNTVRHREHPTTDLRLGDIPAMKSWAVEQLTSTILPTLAVSYNFEREQLTCCDLFFVKYEANTEKGGACTDSVIV